MPDVLLADTCVCGVAHWHVPAGSVEAAARTGSSSGNLEASRFLWCKKCGSIRAIFESHWQIPLDRAGDLPSSVPLETDELPTNPGTPAAKRPSAPDVKRRKE
jgi:hypothetical protein